MKNTKNKTRKIYVQGGDTIISKQYYENPIALMQ